jgi:hypothetical protein
VQWDEMEWDGMVLVGNGGAEALLHLT